MHSPPKLTTHLVQIEQAAHDVALGQISIDEFGAVVVGLDRLFRQKLEEVREVLHNEIPDDFLPEIADEMDVGQRGIECYLCAMAEFFAYIRERDLERIHRGLALSREANDMVNEALTRNWQTYDTYQRAADEFIRQVQAGTPPT